MEDRFLSDRHLFIIARDQPSLWDYLRREFSREANVEVILDRRLGRDRRARYHRDNGAHPVAVAASDRRLAERRNRAAVDAQLRTVGYAMLRVS